jgi:UPF0716 protein FxsA
MPLLLLLLFIGIPIAEIAVFIEVGDQIGLGWTLASILGTAIIGTALVRHQGMQTLARVRASMDRKELPVQEVLSGVCILLAGILLLTPGFVTDAVGFLLLIPPFRVALAGAVIASLRRNGRFTMTSTGGAAGGGFRPPPGGRGPIIDGEFEEVNEDATSDPNPDSPWNKNKNKALENRGDER